MKLTDETPVETNIRLSLASHSYIYPLGIIEDVLVEVSEHVYPVDFIILDIKEDKKRTFILGTPFLTMAKAVIKFDKGTITLRSGKSKVSFHRIPESLYKVEKGIKNDIEPIAPTMTVNRKAHLLEDKQIPSVGVFNEVFSTWITFGGNTLDLGSIGEETDKITDLHQIHKEVLFTERGDGIAGIKRRCHDLSSDGIRDLATASGRGRLKEDLESST
ncbi:zinc finger, CCHC-type containing protein [Tanacetum coccineum]